MVCGQGGLLRCPVFLIGLLKFVETNSLSLGLYIGSQGERQVWQNTKILCLTPDKCLGIATLPTEVTLVPKDTNL